MENDLKTEELSKHYTTTTEVADIIQRAFNKEELNPNNILTSPKCFDPDKYEREITIYAMETVQNGVVKKVKIKIEYTD